MSQHAVKTKEATILLVGNPNVGKSTIFNHVTGATQKTMNAPGTTVDVMTGMWKSLNARIVDLPGTYSLIPTSLDEEVVSDTIAGAPGSVTASAAGGIDLVLAVLDGGSLTRSLYMLGQLAQTGQPLAAVITMVDVASADGRKIDAAALAQELGIPVMTMDPRKGTSYDLLADFVRSALAQQPHVRGLDPEPSAPGYSAKAAARYCPPTAAGDGRDLLAQTLCGCGRTLGIDEECYERGCAKHGDCGCNESATRQSSPCGCGHQGPTTLGIPAVLPSENEDSLASQAELSAQDADLARAATLFAWVERVEQAIGDRPTTTEPSRSDRVDQIFLHPIFGTVIFLGLMWVLFKAAGEWITPIMDWIDGRFTSTKPGAVSLANGLGWLLERVGADGTWVEALLVGGVATGLGVVASFVPLMLVIFAAISILEDSGYMARVAFLGDRMMRKIGLDGRVILPLIMGFGCNLPSLAAARSLPSARQRLVTVLITPYTSCAARLTVYLMVAKIFFPKNAGTIVWTMYVLSIVFVVAAAWILKFFITRGKPAAPLMLILPAYQAPRPVVLLTRAAQNTWSFVKGAGKIILLMTLVVWALGAIPFGAGAEGKGFADPELHMEDSVYGQMARGLEPIFEPAGFGDWHMTGALMTGFVAKETLISSIVTSYNMDPEAAGDAEDNGDDLGVLPELLTETFTETAGEHSGLAAFSFLVFVLAYTPCLATVAEQARLIGGRRTAIAVVVQLAVAWVIAVGVFQIGRLFL